MMLSPAKRSHRGDNKNPAATVTGFSYSAPDLENDLTHAFESLKWKEYVKSDSKVFVEPNFTLPFYKAGVTTTETLLEATLNVLKDRASEIFVGESDGGSASFTADYSLRNHGVPEICRRTGATMLNLSKVERTRISERVNRRLVEVTLPRTLLEMDESVSIPVLKVHAVTGVSLSLKNMWGCHPDGMRLFDHTHLAERLALIAKVLHLRFVVIDAINGLNRRGPMHGDPVRVGVVLVGDNPVATDATATRLMGFRAEDVGHIITANRAGLGPYRETDIQIIADLTPFQQHFYQRATVVDLLGTLTFRSAFLTKLVFDSALSKPVYSVVGRKFRKKILKPGDEL